MSERKKQNDCAEMAVLEGYEDIVSLLCAAPEREFCDISGDVMKAIAHRRMLRRCGIASLASAAAAAVVAILMLLSAPQKIGSETATASVDPRVSSAEWLVSSQEEDGTWNPAHWGGSAEYIPAVTGFAMMSLISAEGREHDAIVSASAQAFRATQATDGRLGGTAGQMSYNHAIATVALLKLYETGRFPELFTVVDGAVNHIRVTQNSTGGWGGGGEGSADMWMVDALAKARTLGWQDKGGHLRRGIRKLEAAPSSFSMEIASAGSLSEKCQVVEKVCGKWIDENPVARAGGMVYAKAVASR